MSYKELYNAWKREKEGNVLQQLDKNFYAELSQYIKIQKEELQTLDEKTLRGRLVIEENKNVHQLLASLIQCRYQKIFRIVSEGKQLSPELLTSDEEIMYSGIVSTKNEMEKILNDVLRGHAPQAIEAKVVRRPKRILVRFLQAIPAIIGPDMSTYGPFKVEDIAHLPVENAEILIKHGIAIEVEME